MSTRRYCDFCGSEIPTDRNHDGLYRNNTTLRTPGNPRTRTDVQVTISLDFGDLKPDVCVGCVFRAVDAIDPSPQDAAEEPDP